MNYAIQLLKQELGQAEGQLEYWEAKPLWSIEGANKPSREENINTYRGVVADLKQAISLIEAAIPVK